MCARRGGIGADRGSFWIVDGGLFVVGDAVGGREDGGFDKGEAHNSIRLWVGQLVPDKVSLLGRQLDSYRSCWHSCR